MGEWDEQRGEERSHKTQESGKEFILHSLQHEDTQEEVEVDTCDSYNETT